MSEKQESEKDIMDAEVEHLEDKEFWFYPCQDCGNPFNMCTCGGYND